MVIRTCWRAVGRILYGATDFTHDTGITSGVAGQRDDIFYHTGRAWRDLAGVGDCFGSHSTHLKMRSQHVACHGPYLFGGKSIPEKSDSQTQTLRS